MNFTPCISTDVGDASLIISGVGILVPIEDPEALMEALKEYHRILIDENDVYIKYCLKGIDKIRREYDIKIITKKYFKVWQNIK